MTWFFTGCLKSFDHLAFDRTLDAQKGEFEFFVPTSMERTFLDFMQYFENKGIVIKVQKVPNRLIDEAV